MYSVRIVAAIGLLASLAGGSQASEPVIPLAKMNVDGSFLGEEGKPPAIDISGMGCVPQQGDIRNCLVINDENKAAQFAVVRNNGIAIGGPISLIGDAPDPRTFGSAPNETCKKVDDFDNLDGEGVAYAAPFFYVVGSHGCGRSKGKFRLSSFILARVRVDAQGRPVDASGRLLGEKEFSSAVETTYRVTDWLRPRRRLPVSLQRISRRRMASISKASRWTGTRYGSVCGHRSKPTRESQTPGRREPSS